LEQILARETMLAAWARVKANKGEPGIDGMSIEAFPAFARQHWDRIRSALYQGSYRPAAVRRVMIAKATGGERPLGIATVLDRLIQQAISQIIAPLFEETFHVKSFGFRPQRRARQALAELERAHADGYRFAVDCDLKSFFDTVSHDLLLGRLRRKISDQRVLRLISRYLRAGVQLPDGSRRPTPTGVSQGSPLSPLLANVMLDDLDWELDRRGLRFARYADDFLIFAGSKRAALRVLGSVRRFVERRLKLVVNPTKSQAAKLSQCTFLGFRLSRGKLRWTDSAEARFKDRVRAITSRSSGRSMAVRIAALRRYVIGWLNYFGHSHSYREVLKLDTWLRRRVRMCYWKDWKRPRPRRRRLLALGADLAEVHLATRSRKGYWRGHGRGRACRGSRS
jgi:RNA-directed DNA polymerase